MASVAKLFVVTMEFIYLFVVKPWLRDVFDKGCVSRLTTKEKEKKLTLQTMHTEIEFSLLYDEQNFG